MVTMQCIDKERKGVKILTYILKDETDRVVRVSADKLKEMIKNKQIVVSNLKLASNGRLFSVKEEEKRTKIDRALVLRIQKELETIRKNGEFFKLCFNTVDNLDKYRNGAKVILGTDESENLILVKEGSALVLSALPYEIVNGKSLFEDIKLVRYIDITNVITSELTNMKNMFKGCTGLEELRWRINSKKVVDMSGLFEGCLSLSRVDLNILNTSKVIDMSRMFASTAFEKLDLRNFDTHNVKNYVGMFEECSELEDIDISHFVFNGEIGIQGMFRWCDSIKEIDLSGIDYTSMSIINISGLFYGCSDVLKINMGEIPLAYKDILMNALFKKCNKLEVLVMHGYADDVTNELKQLLKELCPKLKLIKAGKKLINLQNQ